MLLAILCVVSFAVVPDLYGVIPQFSLAKSYFISLLAAVRSPSLPSLRSLTSDAAQFPSLPQSPTRILQSKIFHQLILKQDNSFSFRLFSPSQWDSNKRFDRYHASWLAWGIHGAYQGQYYVCLNFLHSSSGIGTNARCRETIHVDEMDDLEKEVLYPTVLRIRVVRLSH